MFLASSEIAVAIRVASVGEYPSWAASAHPRWRAVTMSRSDVIGTVIFSSATRTPYVIDPDRRPPDRGSALHTRAALLRQSSRCSPDQHWRGFSRDGRMRWRGAGCGAAAAVARRALSGVCGLHGTGPSDLLHPHNRGGPVQSR